MRIMNKRNAVLGWLTWKVGKGMAKKKAKEAMPHKSHQHGGKKKPAFLAGIAAAVGGAFWFLRKGKGGGHEGSGSE